MNSKETAFNEVVCNIFRLNVKWNKMSNLVNACKGSFVY